MIRGRRGKKAKPSRKRRGRAPGPSGVPLTAGPAWRVTAGLYWWVTFTVVAGLALCFAASLIVRDEVALDLHHRVALARVTDTHAGKGPGTARVVFTEDGSVHEAVVQQPLLGSGLEVDDQLRVEYLPSRPAVARRAGAHDFLSFAAVIGTVVVPPLVVPLLRRRSRRR
ncbi:hypothetical protein [Actinoplanes sp. M2I2]|uniref:hypothetical protein n=1 Tax=Actinoplanes sp. M2I2 TaxID=1734444 RepID=UPI0020227C4B|nr:hypothetical protein [Actinoplanes sp. M2I2]